MNALVIAKRELAAYFLSPIAYVIGAAFLFVTGLVFYLTIAFDYLATLSQVFTVMAIILLFVAPILTMRLLAEEAHSGTLELLMTAPVRDWEVVFGKFVAAFLFFVALLVPTLYYLLVLTFYGTPDLPVTFSGYLGLVLLGGMLLSLGVLTSAMSANQIIAAVLGITLALTFWLVGALASTLPGPVGALLAFLAVQNYLADFLVGLITTSSLVYFLSVMAAALFLATRVLEIRRWRK